MTKEWKSELIRSIITLAIVVIGAIVTVSMTSNYNNEVSIKDKIDSKVDKVDFQIKCTEINTNFDKKADKGTIEKMSRQIEFLYQNEIKKNQK